MTKSLLFSMLNRLWPTYVRPKMPNALLVALTEKSPLFVMVRGLLPYDVCA
jgi:hypothetical protein